MEPQPSPFILGLPKAELHLHLEGSVDPSALLELRKRHGKHSTLAEVEQLYRYHDFPGFLLAFKSVTDDLQSGEDYEVIAYRLMQSLKVENTLHAEIYISVGVCLWRKLDFGAEAARDVFEVAVHYRDRHVVGVGIGGDEQKAPPELFRDAYAYASDNGLRLTAHAGESAGPESIWGALNLRAERIGHGLTAWQDTELVEELARRQIPVEICLTSNLRTGCCGGIGEHPLRSYFDKGLMVTLNSDDPAMFSTSLAREYQLAQDSFAFSDEHLRELARNSFEASFLPPEKKLAFLNLFDAAAARS